MPYAPILNRSDVQSVARTFPQGVSLVTSGRPNLRYIAIQNRDNKDVYFWHGEMPSGATGQGATVYQLIQSYLFAKVDELELAENQQN